MRITIRPRTGAEMRARLLDCLALAVVAETPGPDAACAYGAWATVAQAIDPVSGINYALDPVAHAREAIARGAQRPPLAYLWGI